MYNEKKHVCYVELFKLIRFAEGAVFGLRGLVTRPSFIDYSKEDVEKYLSSFNSPKKIVSDVINLWDVNKDKAIEIIREYEKYRDLNNAENKFLEARNYWFSNELYFSEEINPKIDEYFQTLYRLYLNYEIPDEVPRGENADLKKKSMSCLMISKVA